MPEQIDGERKKERAKICLNLSEEMYDRYMDSLIGRECDVLIETHEDGRSFGRISEYAEVCLPELLERGTMVKAVLLSKDRHMLYGERKANHETE
jgi:tRNA A37 methylthiotransferase MiaB